MPVAAREYLERFRPEQPKYKAAGLAGQYYQSGTEKGDVPAEELKRMQYFIAHSDFGKWLLEQEDKFEQSLSKSIDAFRNKLSDGRAKVEDYNRKINKNFASFFTGSNNEAIAQANELQNNVILASSQLAELEKLQNAYKDVKGGKGGFKQFYRELGRRFPEALTSTATFGLSDLFNAIELHHDQDKELTREVTELLNQFQNLHAHDRSIAQDIANGTLQSVSFIAQFAGTGGIAKGLTKGTEMAIAEKLGGSITAKAIGKMGEATGNAFVRTALMPSTLTSAYQINMENPGSFLDAYALAFKRNFVESLSEGFGGYLPNNFLPNNPLIQKISKYTGIQGAVPELIEEELATALHASWGDGSGEWSDFVDPRNQLITAATVGLMQLPYMAIHGTGYAAGKYRNIRQKRSIRKGYNKNTANIRRLFGDESKAIIDQINKMVDSDPGNAKRFFNFAQNIANDADFSDKQKDGIVKYAMAYDAYSGMNRAKAEQIQQAQQRSVQIVKEHLNRNMNAVVLAVVDGKERKIVGGTILLNEDGTIDLKNSDSVVYIQDDELKRQAVPIASVESVLESMPVEEVIKRVSQMVTDPIIAQQENDEVREYEEGESVRFGVPGTQADLFGRIIGRNENGSYSVLPDGFAQPVAVEPRQIINEDHLIGVDNGVEVSYMDESGREVRGIVGDAYSLRKQGLIVIDGKEIPVDRINGPYKEKQNDSEPGNTSQKDNNLIEKNPENEVTPPDGESKMTEQILARAPKREDGEVDYDALLEQNPEDFATLYESEEGAEEASRELSSISKKLSEKIQSEQKKLENATSINKKKDVKKVIAGLTEQKDRVDGIINSRYAVPVDESRQESTEVDNSERSKSPNSAPLTEQQAEDLIAQMEAAAVEAPVLELTPENWYAEFGEEGNVET
ncbi:MAG: hypothetical protein LBS46_01090, partial [Dysgonamonadaceae bacterium]|nr:hypothetical protein [Dysgonamonadaceae bacterium]